MLLKRKFKLIIYSYLPKKFITLFLDSSPELENMFDHILARENCIDIEDYIVRDLSILMDGRRSKDSMLAVDCYSNSSDPKSVQFICIPPYIG